MKKTILTFSLVLVNSSSAFAESARGYIKSYRGYDFFAGLNRDEEHVVVGQDFFTETQWQTLANCTEKHDQFMTVVKYTESDEKSDELGEVQSVVCVRNRTFFPQWKKVFGNE